MSDNFFKVLSIEENTELDRTEAKLRENIQDCIYPKKPEDKNLPLNKEIEKLNDFMSKFFDYSRDWLRGHYVIGKSDGSTAHAEELKVKGAKLLQSLQDELTQFVINYLKLERFIALVREQIKKREDKDRHSIDVEWTDSIAVFVERYRKTFAQIIDIIDDHKKAYDLLKERDDQDIGMERFESRVKDILGFKKAQPLIRALFSELRGCEFSKARQTLKQIEEQGGMFSQGKMKEAMNLGNDLIEFYDSKEAFLRNRENDRLFLRYKEIKLLYETQKMDLDKAYKYIRKYHMPYLRYKLESLIRVKKQVMLIGSYEQLLTLHRKLLKGLSSKLVKIEHERIFENEVVTPIDYLLKQQFSEGPKLIEKAEAIVREFLKALEESRFLDERDLSRHAIIMDADDNEGEPDPEKTAEA